MKCHDISISLLGYDMITRHNHVSCNSSNEYDEFFTLLKRYYPLYEACKLGNCAKLFDTWNTDGAGAGEMIRTVRMPMLMPIQNYPTRRYYVVTSPLRTPPYHGIAPCQWAMTVNYGAIRGYARSYYIATGVRTFSLFC